jgi:general L-amino acid transport system permease protein
MTSNRDAAYVAAGLIPPSKPPASGGGVIHWLRSNLFNGVIDSMLTLISITLVVSLIPPLIDWAFLKGVWNANSLEECREIVAATHGKGAQGACWAVINENIDLLLFGLYPPQLHWRPVLAFVLIFVALAPVLFSSLPRRMLWFSAIYPIIGYILIWGIAEQTNEDLVRSLATSAGMDISTEGGMKAAWAEFSSTSFTHLGTVRTAQLGGFLLAIIIAVTGIAMAIPFGFVLAFGRQFSIPALNHYRLRPVGLPLCCSIY